VKKVGELFVDTAIAFPIVLWAGERCVSRGTIREEEEIITCLNSVLLEGVRTK